MFLLLPFLIVNKEDVFVFSLNQTIHHPEFTGFQFKKETYQFLWLLTGIIFISGFFYTPQVPVTRLHFILPALSILIGLGLSALIIKNQLLALPLLIMIVFLNFYRFYVQTPKAHHNPQESLVVKVLQENPKKNVYHLSSKPAHPIFLTAISSLELSDRYFPIHNLNQFSQRGILVSYENNPLFNHQRIFDYSRKSFIYIKKF